MSSDETSQATVGYDTPYLVCQQCLWHKQLENKGSSFGSLSSCHDECQRCGNAARWVLVRAKVLRERKRQEQKWPWPLSLLFGPVVFESHSIIVCPQDRPLVGGHRILI